MGDRATEPRVAPVKFHPTHEEEEFKQMYLKKIKPKPETKPILQSLKDGIENLKKTTVRERSETRQQTSGFLDRITKLTHGSRSRNPAKKSASFTFAVRPEVAMRSKERYSSLEPDPTEKFLQNDTKQNVQRSVSTSVLEVPVNVELQPDYSRVRDSLTPLPPSPPKSPQPKTEEIYAEICDNTAAIPRCPGSHVMARIKIFVKHGDDPPPKQKFVNSVMLNQETIVRAEDEMIYNTVF